MLLDELISEINLEYITPFRVEDEDVFRKQFKELGVRYSNSWLYTLRNSQNQNGELGFKYWDGKILFTINHRNNSIYFGKMLGLSNTNIDNVIHLIETFKRTISTPIILKKADPKYIKLLSKKFTHTSTNLNEFDFEDENFPEKYIQLSKLIDSSDNRILPKRFRQGVQRFLNKEYNVTEVKSNVLQTSLENVLKELSKGNNLKYSTYLPVIRYLKNKKILKDYILIVYKSDEGFEGLYILEKFNKTECGFYCGLTSTKVGGLTEYLDYEVFNKLQNLAYEQVYLGGSETEGVVKYVEKLLPLDPDYMEIPLIIL